VRALARDAVVVDRRHVEVTAREAVEVVRLVRFEHVRLELGVVHATAQHEAMVGERVLRVLDVVPELRARGIAEPRREHVEHFLRIELGGRAGV